MDKQYQSIFESIFRAATDPGSLDKRSPGFRDELVDAFLWDQTTGGLARDAIELAEHQVPPGSSLREDAKALLAVNLQAMVIVPLRLGGRVSDSELAEAVRSDAAMLVGGASFDETTESQVSAHRIIDSLSEN